MLELVNEINQLFEKDQYICQSKDFKGIKSLKVKNNDEVVLEVYMYATERIRLLLNQKEFYSTNSDKFIGFHLYKGILNVPIEVLNLSVRSYHILLKYGCPRIGDVVKLSKYDVYSFHNMGPLNRKEIFDAMEYLGFPLKDK